MYTSTYRYCQQRFTQERNDNMLMLAMEQDMAGLLTTVGKNTEISQV